MFSLLVGAWVLATACGPADRAIVAEVYYDAPGDDTGQEFVELFNPTANAIPLAGVRIEAGDGAGAGRWTLRWTGGVRDTIAAGARFVVGGARVDPPPQAILTLDLQNGPDAVRLVWPDGASEVVGWGALAFPEYSCGAPAADAPAGFSLARVPDVSRLGDNALDFRVATPSPGRANLPGRNAAIVPGSLELDPPRPSPGASARLTGLAVNRGAQVLAPGELGFTVEDEPLEEGGGTSAHARFRAGSSADTRRSRSGPVVPVSLEPGDTLGFEVALESLAAGKHRLWASLRLLGDERADDDRDSLRVRVGPGPLAITEIQFHPADGEGEWVEVLNRASVPLDPATFTISDRGSGRGVPRDGAVLPPDSLGVLAQDRLALLALHPELDSSRVWQATPWSALNNSDDSTGIADHVVLRESDGLPCDEVAYRSASVPTGVPIEWRDGAWQPALDPRGSPLGFPRALPPALRRFDLRPARVSDADPRVRIEWALPWPRARVKVTLYDFAGREVARLWPESGAAGRGARDLTLGGVPPGFYWAALEARPESGVERLAETRPLRVVGAR